MHPLEIASKKLRKLLNLEEPYSIPSASENVKQACWSLCAELHKLSDGHSLTDRTWIDSFIGFDLSFDESDLQTIEGTVICGDGQPDMGFSVDRNSDGNFLMEFFPPTRKCRPFMFRFVGTKSAEQAGGGNVAISNIDSAKQSAL